MSQFFSQESHLTFQQSQQNLTIVVPLVKFSCSSVNQGSTTGIQWSHYLRNDLELVIQEMQNGSSGNEKNLMMKVVAGADYLEEQNLDDIARNYKDFIPSPGSRNPVDVVVKRPILALRYPKRNNSAMSITSFMPHSKPSIETLKKKQALYTSQIGRQQQEIQPSNLIVPSSNDISSSHSAYRSPVFLPNHEGSPSTSRFFETGKTQYLLNRLASFSSVDDTNNLRHNGHGPVLDSFSPSECQPLARPAEYPIFSSLGKRLLPLSTDHDICSGFLIPPKRQLPFATVKDPSRSESVSAIEPNQPVEAPGQRKRSLKELSDANSSNTVTTTTEKPTKRRFASRKAMHLQEIDDRLTKPVPSTDVLAGNSLGVPILSGQPSPLALWTVAALAPSNLPSKLQEKEISATQRLLSTPHDKPTARKMAERSTQTQTLSGRDHTAALKSTRSASLVEVPSNFPAAFVLQEDLDLFISRYSSRSQINLPPNYNKVPAEERHKMLNDFILKNLENEDFHKMAKDTDASARRVGLTR
ncbi:predicted protein [Sclerotinia sclerotiorum 1980 UF-70]|uniref:Uncharacterized protein n=1 Tax=Sclerotinia sclerotiorum (strain ATCC 18683 / 1980 / Ss-1) TaxID=665079 RepID=A7EAV3_SCLS1|nr:predicted protein [Sclerotinia sclerotiorum 1980 UF-70]EDN99581.1 predicted protein [Sclerotinia sclerotiorum 1980 UF-70]